MVIRDAPVNVLFLSASLQALRTTINATFQYAFYWRIVGTAYISQSRKALTALDLGPRWFGCALRAACGGFLKESRAGSQYAAASVWLRGRGKGFACRPETGSLIARIARNRPLLS